MLSLMSWACPQHLCIKEHSGLRKYTTHAEPAGSCLTPKSGWSGGRLGTERRKLLQLFAQGPAGAQGDTGAQGKSLCCGCGLSACCLEGCCLVMISIVLIVEVRCQSRCSYTAKSSRRLTRRRIGQLCSCVRTTDQWCLVQWVTLCVGQDSPHFES
jgi:hypothetical protein